METSQWGVSFLFKHHIEQQGAFLIEGDPWSCVIEDEILFAWGGFLPLSWVSWWPGPFLRQGRPLGQYLMAAVVISEVLLILWWRLWGLGHAQGMPGGGLVGVETTYSKSFTSHLSKSEDDVLWMGLWRWALWGYEWAWHGWVWARAQNCSPQGLWAVFALWVYLSEQWHINLPPAQVPEPAWLRRAIHSAAEITCALKLYF